MLKVGSHNRITGIAKTGYKWC